jgi:hypothetical protein
MTSIVLEFTTQEEDYLQQQASKQKIDVATYIRRQVLVSEREPPKEPETTTRLRAIATESIDETRKDLHAKGIGYVESRGENVVQCLPDGSIEVIASLKS